MRELVHAGHDVAIFHRTAGGSPSQRALQIQGDRNRLAAYEEEILDFAPHVIVDMILSSGKQGKELATMAQALNARAVAISSMDVYRAWGVLLGTEPGGLEPMPITEDSPVRTARRTYPPEIVKTMKGIFTWLNQDYDKVAVEEAVMGGGTGNTVVRLPMVYGPRDPLHRMHSVLKRIADGRSAIILAGDHAAWRGPRGYVENVAHAIALAAISEHARGRTYHVCEEPCLSELEWVKKIAAPTAWDGRFVVIPREKTPKHLRMPGNAAQHVVANSARIRAELGYNEPLTTDVAIQHTIAWEQANPPAGASFHQFDYEAEDLALAGR
jgi:nucleoside-diphosphate-sugar epimerase